MLKRSTNQWTRLRLLHTLIQQSMIEPNCIFSKQMFMPNASLPTHGSSMETFLTSSSYHVPTLSRLKCIAFCLAALSLNSLDFSTQNHSSINMPIDWSNICWQMLSDHIYSSTRTLCSAPVAYINYQLCGTQATGISSYKYNILWKKIISLLGNITMSQII